MSKYKCFRCNCCHCYKRIYTQDLSFDEIACPEHGRDLEAHADQILGNPGVIRNHSSGTTRKYRGQVTSFCLNPIKQ